MGSSSPRAGEPELHVVLVWERGLDHADVVLDDVRRRFDLREAVRVAWSEEHFARNLTRLYGQDLPAGSDKERECGTGPFLLLLVADPEPRHRRVRTSHGRRVVNARMLEAKRLYRRWTGGGYRVHATLDRRETEKDVFLLLGRRLDSVAPSGAWDGDVAEMNTDLVGASGWRSRDELLSAVEATVASVALPALGDAACVLVDDRWWATRIVNDGGPDEARVRHEPVVAGARFLLDVTEVGDGTLPERWQRAMLDRAERDAGGLRMAAARDLLHLGLAAIARGDLPEPPAWLVELARSHALADGWQERERARELVGGYVASLSPPAPSRRVATLADWLLRR